jgi:hypothetical protein
MTDSSHFASHSEWLLQSTLQKRVVVLLVNFSPQSRIWMSTPSTPECLECQVLEQALSSRQPHTFRAETRGIPGELRRATGVAQACKPLSRSSARSGMAQRTGCDLPFDVVTLHAPKDYGGGTKEGSFPTLDNINGVRHFLP